MDGKYKGLKGYSSLYFEKIAILGVGLMGASFAKAVRKLGITAKICGYGRNETTLAWAKENTIIDCYDTTLSGLAKGADLIILATPVGTFEKLAVEISPFLKQGAIVTDVGSVKGSLVYTLEGLMPKGVHFVGAHPIAGKDQSGMKASSDILYKGALCIVTPTDNTDLTALETVKALWSAIGCSVKTLTPEKHDEIFSSISHLPHIAAYAMINVIAEISDTFFEYAGKGFKDTTRIAGSSPDIWSDICLLNKENITSHIGIYIEKLNAILTHIKNSSKDGLIKEFDNARALRKKMNDCLHSNIEDCIDNV
ncbi:prephenate dehydrogenase [Candidatus Magnetomonas plexicatena]|uniref:prephenate dehydrogenase n=1 Tax=Candidatus Magnetomonas plexicatena TaxID=2552947 RepID=UPI001103EEFB|nr:prephenate dehydrogenase/arogenate dehydrogenase family protein [Nitrospirales bacterium LBB_01]